MVNTKQPYVVIVDVNSKMSEIRNSLEEIANNHFDDILQLKVKLNLSDEELYLGKVKILSLSDFMDEYNNDEILSMKSFISYVWIGK